MTRRKLFSLAVISLAAFAISLPAKPPQTVIGPPTAEELQDGEDLAERLRDAVPTENSSRHGKIIVESDDSAREVPIVCDVLATDTNWQTDYNIPGTTTNAAESLEVIHITNGPSVYLYARAPGPSAPLPKLETIPPSETDIPLAGSDFSLSDLGLQFLFWPVQRRFKNETYSDRLCNVLESRNPGGKGTVRIMCYFDDETHGLISAKAYDANDALVKVFSLNHSSFIKIHGHYRLEKMDITNRKSGSHTEIKFDLKE